MGQFRNARLKSLCAQYCQISSNKEFLTLRLEYWGFLLAFSGIILDGKVDGQPWPLANLALILSSFFGVISTISLTMSVSILETNPYKIRMVLTGLGLLFDIVYVVSFFFVLFWR